MRGRAIAKLPVLDRVPGDDGLIPGESWQYRWHCLTGKTVLPDRLSHFEDAKMFRGKLMLANRRNRKC